MRPATNIESRRVGILVRLLARTWKRTAAEYIAKLVGVSVVEVKKIR